MSEDLTILEKIAKEFKNDFDSIREHHYKSKHEGV